MSVLAPSVHSHADHGPVNVGASPLTKKKFAQLMVRMGPFEQSPKIAVAVSGGADSLALTFLAHDWAAAHGGRVIGLTVDHGMRTGSSIEAKQVGQWLAAHNIEHHILNWTGEKPTTGVQAAARRARYELLNEWCREHACLHLMLAHNQGDQAETVAMRLERSSGLYGLAGMPVVSYTPQVRYLRPLLSVPRAALEATLNARMHGWVSDPSNQNLDFARVRMRRFLSAPEAGGAMNRLPSLAAAAGSLRSRLEQRVASALAESTWIHPTGFASLNSKLFGGYRPFIRQRMIARLVTMLGGRDYEPGDTKLASLCRAMANVNWPGATLGGCQIRLEGDDILVLPETRRGNGDAFELAAPVEFTWRRLFRIRLSGTGAAVVRRLMRSEWTMLRKLEPALKTDAIPSCQRSNLPILEVNGSVSAVPHLGYKSGNQLSETPEIDGIRLMPITPLCDGRLYLAPGDS